MSSKEKIPPNVLDPDLYEQIKKEAKKKFKAWPSAYASMWLQREYMKRGGLFEYKTHGLEKWRREKWIDICDGSQCGRNMADIENYPVCRPSIKIDERTPKLASELTEEEIKKLCKRKQKNPKNRLKFK